MKRGIILVIAVLFLCPSHSLSQPPYFSKGIDYYKDGAYEEALDIFLKARQEQPTSSIIAYFLGLTYKRMQDFPKAKSALKEAVTLKPPVREAFLELVDVLYNLNELDEALNYLDMAEKAEIDPAQTAFVKGLVLLKQGRNLEAVEQFKKAKGIDKSLTQAADYQIGRAYLQERQFSDAKRVFKEAITAAPETDLASLTKDTLDAIKRKLWEERPFRNTVSIGHQIDWNVVLNPNDPVFAAIADDYDNRDVYSLRSEYAPRLDGPFGIRAQYNFYLARQYNLERFNINSHAFTLIPSYDLKDRILGLPAMLTFPVTYNHVWVHANSYLRTINVGPELSFMITRSQIGRISAMYQRKEFPQPAPLDTFFPDEDRDGHTAIVYMSWSYLFRKSFLTARYEYWNEETDGTNWSFTGHKIGMAFSTPISIPHIGEIKSYISVEGFWQKFDNEYINNLRSVINPTGYPPNKERRDGIFTLSTIFAREIYRNLDLQVQYGYSRDNSNVPVFDFDGKHVVGWGLEYRF
jgi:tetratricopeptide (TPR) repeat protein